MEAPAYDLASSLEIDSRTPREAGVGSRDKCNLDVDVGVDADLCCSCDD